MRPDSELVYHAVSLLHALKLPIMTGLEGWQRAFERPVTLTQHQFNPPDHRVALSEPGAVFAKTEPAHP